MKNIEGMVKGVIIPSGSAEQDIVRAQTAIRYNQENKLNAPYIISGIGPDINEALIEKPQRDYNLDFHQELHNYMVENTSSIMGLDILSVNSVQNILNTFPLGVSGRYAIVSYPLHLKRFKRIFEKVKKEEKVSQDLELEYVPTSRISSPREIFYETIRRIKDFVY